jgi:hypothetical protein
MYMKKHTLLNSTVLYYTIVNNTVSRKGFQIYEIKQHIVRVRQVDQITALTLTWAPLRKSTNLFVLLIGRTTYLLRYAN